MASQSQCLVLGRSSIPVAVLLLSAAGCTTFVRPPAPAGFSPTVVIKRTPSVAPWIVAPTHTPEPTLTPIANPLREPGLNARQAAGDSLPSVRHDLVYLDGGRLMRWNHASGRIETILGGAETNSANIAVVSMRAKPGLKRAVVLYTDAAAPEAHHVGLLDFEPLQLRPVFTVSMAANAPTPRLDDLVLSPDGRHLLAVMHEPERYPHGELVLYTETGGRQLLKTCDVRNHSVLSMGCGAAVWTADGQGVLWDDGGGFWRLDPFGGVLPQLISSVSESGQGKFMPLAMAQCPGIFYAGALSPGGQQALLIMPGYEWWHQGLLDIETQQCMRFEASFRGHRPDPAQVWQWLPDGQLLATGPYSQVQRLRVETRPGEAMTVTVTGGVTLTQASKRLSLHQHVTASGDVLLAIASARGDHDALRGVYRLDLSAGTMQRLASLPASVFAPGGSALPEFIWAPDGSGLIYRETNAVTGQPELQFSLYVGLDGSPSAPELADVSTLIPAAAKDLAWLD